MHTCVMNDQVDFRRTYSGPTTDPVGLEAKVVLVIYAERCCITLT